MRSGNQDWESRLHEVHQADLHSDPKVTEEEEEEEEEEEKGSAAEEHIANIRLLDR